MKIVVLSTRATAPLADELKELAHQMVPRATVTTELESVQRWDPCVVLVPVAEGMEDDTTALFPIQEAVNQDHLIVVVPRSTADYHPDDLPAELGTLSELLAVGLDAPEDLRVALHRHLGLDAARDPIGVFISYSWKDGKDLANALRERLEHRNIDWFQDEHRLVAGAKIQDEIEEAIATRDVLLLVDTPAARSSHWVKEELINARARRIPVLVVGTERALGIEGVEDATYLHCEGEPSDEVMGEIEDVVRHARARRTTFSARARRVAKIAGRTLGYREQGRERGRDSLPLRLARAGHVVHVEASRVSPNAHSMLVVQDNAKATGSSSALLVAGDTGFSTLTQRMAHVFGPALVPRVRVCPLPNVATSLALEGRPDGEECSARVMLSASLPEVRGSESRVLKQALYDFISGLTTGLVGAGAHMVFGGHPSVTPVVCEAIQLLGPHRKGSASLHQLCRFENRAPPAAFEEEVWGEVHRSGAPLSPGQTITDGIGPELGAMRNDMVEESNAAVLVGGKLTGLGGKAGVRDEFERFRAQHPRGRVHLVGLLGGAAAELVAEHRDEDRQTSPIRIHESRDVDLVVAQLLADLLAPPAPAP